MNNYDLIIVGAGPAGIFTALELLRKSSKATGPRICLIEKGKPVEKRHCPKDKTGHCVNCKPTCAITTGFSGAGAFSDGKLSLSYQVGGELPELIGEDFAQELINYTDKIYLEFGADPHVEGVYEGSEIKEIRKRAIQAGLQLVDCPIRHLGTEKAQQLYLNIQNYLLARGVEMLFNTECDNILLEGSECKGVVITEKGERRELRAALADAAAGGGAEGNDRLAGEVIGLDERVHRPRGDAPPDRVADVDGVIVGPVICGRGLERHVAQGLVVMLARDAAVGVVVVQVGARVRLGRFELQQIAARRGGDGLGIGPFRLPLLVQLLLGL